MRTEAGAGNDPIPAASHKRGIGFKHAIAGIASMLRSETNARVHAAVTVCVCGVAAALGLTKAEWCWIVLAMAAVWVAEALNTALELLADAQSTKLDPRIKNAKDVAAGAVFISALGAAIVGVLAIGPHLLGLVRG